MSKKMYDGIPDSITREQHTALAVTLGIDPSSCTEIVLNPEGAFVTVFECTPEGSKRTNSLGDGFIKSKIFIPVEDPQDAEDPKGAHSPEGTHYRTDAVEVSA